jgi:hypothetical protein
MNRLLYVILVTICFINISRADEKINKLDCGGHRYVWFNGVTWTYIWLNDQEKSISFILNSIYSPGQSKFKILTDEKIVIGDVVVGAKVK